MPNAPENIVEKVTPPFIGLIVVVIGMAIIYFGKPEQANVVSNFIMLVLGYYYGSSSTMSKKVPDSVQAGPVSGSTLTTVLSEVKEVLNPPAEPPKSQ